MRWIGRLSYSWYLWHWPFIVLAVLALNNDGTPVRMTAAALSLGAAYLAFNLVENPIRFSQITDSVLSPSHWIWHTADSCAM